MDSILEKIEIVNGTNCMAAALAYLDLGFSPTVLCPPDHAIGDWHKCKSPGKRPWHKWKELQTRKPTREEIENRFRSVPTSNVGTALGPVSGLVRLDVDSEEAEAKLTELSGGIVPLTWEFSSGGGGRGLLFAIPEGVVLKTTAEKGESIHSELRIQAQGAQTVLPPSLHVSGRRYSWKSGCSPWDIPAAPMPAWMIDFMRKDKPKEKKWTAKASGGDDVSTARKALAALKASRADDYDTWYKVGMALHSVDTSLLPDWTDWSAQSGKFQEGDCATKWASFSAGDGIKLGSLVKWAQEDSGFRLNGHVTNGYHFAGDGAETQTTETKPLTDMGNGQRFACEHGDIVRFCHLWGKWLIWDGTRWRIDNAGSAMSLAKKTIGGMYRWAQTQVAQLREDDSDEGAARLKKIKAVLVRV